jgi:hypothetical protein
VFESRLKGDKVTGGWRKLHNEGLHNLYSSPSIVRVIRWSMRWVRNVEYVEGKKNTCRILVAEPVGIRSVGRPRCKWDGNVKIDLKEVR